MKRKPLNRKIIAQALTQQVLKNCKLARESSSQSRTDELTGESLGALKLAFTLDAVDIDTWSRLHNLANNAQYNRTIEQIYNQPPYTGAQLAEARYKAGKVAA